jgi:hypothetical protein
VPLRVTYVDLPLSRPPKRLRTEFFPSAVRLSTSSSSVLYVFAPCFDPDPTPWAAYLALHGPVHTWDSPSQPLQVHQSITRLVDSLRISICSARAQHPFAATTVIVGKALGFRVALNLVQDERGRERLTGCPSELSIVACVALGYSVGKDGENVGLLQGASVPLLLAQGTRDPNSGISRIQRLFDRCAKDPVSVADGHKTLHVVPTGNRSLLVTKAWLKAINRTQDMIDEDIGDAIAKFVSSIVA